jgi:hypothetical protein
MYVFSSSKSEPDDLSVTILACRIVEPDDLSVSILAYRMELIPCGTPKEVFT